MGRRAARELVVAEDRDDAVAVRVNTRRIHGTLGHGHEIADARCAFAVHLANLPGIGGAAQQHPGEVLDALARLELHDGESVVAGDDVQVLARERAAASRAGAEEDAKGAEGKRPRGRAGANFHRHSEARSCRS